MKTFTDKQVVDVAMLVMDNTRKNLADGKVSVAEKNGATAACVAVMMLLGIEVVFVDDKPGLN